MIVSHGNLPFFLIITNGMFNISATNGQNKNHLASNHTITSAHAHFSANSKLIYFIASGDVSSGEISLNETGAFGKSWYSVIYDFRSIFGL
ncbi:MAG: hypothetical protein WCG25_05965 [bacterium]